MKSLLLSATLAVTVLGLTVGASARDVVLPAGTLLQCTMNEPNFSTSTVAVGDPVLCHLHGVTEFGQQAFPRGSYLVGHLENAKNPGHFVGKGYLQLQFDRIGLPTGDLPLEAKVIETRGFRVDRDGKIIGHGHPRRDVVEWMLPPLWPWKVIMLPARGPKPTLSNEQTLSLRLMDDVEIPQVAQTFGPNWHFFKRQSGQLIQPSSDDSVAYRNAASVPAMPAAHASLATYVTRPAVTQLAAIPQSIGASPGTPVFVLKTGSVLALGNYSYSAGRITYTLANGGGGVLNATDIDWDSTTRLNNRRGVRMTLHGGAVPAQTPTL